MIKNSVADSIVGGIKDKSTPLISFNTILDIDIAVVKKFIIDFSTRDIPILDFSMLKDLNRIQLLEKVYNRRVKNPLHLFLKDDTKEDLLNRVYDEYLEDEKSVYKYLVKTDMYNLLLSFNSSSDIIPTILYYSDAQRNILDRLPELKSISKVDITTASRISVKNMQYTQYFLRYISDVEPFIDFYDKTFYFSTSKLNLNEEGTDIDRADLMVELGRQRNYITLFDMYRMDIIDPNRNNKTGEIY